MSTAEFDLQFTEAYQEILAEHIAGDCPEDCYLCAVDEFLPDPHGRYEFYDEFAEWPDAWRQP